ncbi:MAG: hypothetical protein HDS23_07565 [Bacteroides sp.]|nr:hypothetical protein [Bacteroides sp.]MBD5338817.1 hypothetical protein [Bacteroides sp.]
MWYLLNYIAPALHRKEQLDARIEAYNSLNGTDLRVFAPQIVEAKPQSGGTIRIVSRAILFHYIFISGPLEHIKRLASTGGGLSFVLRHPDSLPSTERIPSATTPTVAQPVSAAPTTEKSPTVAKLVSTSPLSERSPAVAKLVGAASSARYVTVSDADIQAFSIIARAYSNRLPYYNPADIDLLDGDEVEVVSGPFTGLKGTFITRRGTQNGNIVVAATSQIGSIAYDIQADTIRIIRFAKDSRRAYDQIDAFIPRLLDALEAYRADRPLTPAQAASLHVFTRRFAVTEIPGAKLDAKLQALLTVAHEILGNPQESAAARARYEKRLPYVTNPRTLRLLHEIIP